jgi:hypothetical protein
MSWNDGEQFERFMEDTLRNISEAAAKEYLGECGDSVDARITAFLKEADALLDQAHAGAALSLESAAGPGPSVGAVNSRRSGPISEECLRAG